MMHRWWQCRSIAAVVLLFFPYAAKRLFELTHPGWVEWLAIDYGARTIMLAGAVVARPTVAKARPTIGWRRFATLAAAVASVVLFISLFAAFHTTRGVQVAAFSFLLGVLFGFLYQRIGRLCPVVVGHYMVDFIAFSGIAVRLHQ